jgi:hypothetical protein
MTATPSPSATQGPVVDAGVVGWWTQFFTIDVSQFIQILFWLVAGSIAVMTYCQARRTVFQPLRVEVFKQQLSLLTKISETFVSRDESELRAHFDLEECVDFNASLLLETFLEQEYQLKRKTSLMDEYRERFPIGLVSAESMEQNFELVAPPNGESERRSSGDPVPDIDWDKFKVPMIAVSQAYDTAYQDILKLVRDPLVPRQLSELLRKLADLASENLRQIEPALEEAAKQLPISYPNEDSVKEPSLRWVGNVWNDRVRPMRPIADEIGDFIREFIQSEQTGFTEVK